jgi:hypothetical protein
MELRGKCAIESGLVRHERGVTDRRVSRDAGGNLRGIRELRHPFRADEGGDLDDGRSGGGQPIDQLDLVGGRHECLLVLQPVAGTNFHHRDPAMGKWGNGVMG